MANLGWVDRAVGSVGDWSAALTAPQATLITGLTVLVIGGGTVAQKFRNDKRDQWWKRAQWAIELALDPEDNLRQVSGLAAITHLASRSEATSSDRLLLWKIVTAQQELYGGDTVPEQSAPGVDNKGQNVDDGSSGRGSADDTTPGEEQ